MHENAFPFSFLIFKNTNMKTTLELLIELREALQKERLFCKKEHKNLITLCWTTNKYFYGYKRRHITENLRNHSYKGKILGEFWWKPNQFKRRLNWLDHEIEILTCIANKRKTLITIN